MRERKQRQDYDAGAACSRVGDTVEVTMRNHEDSWVPHNVDFHAVTGPHGGGHATMTDPGGETGFTFKALQPGLYVYHCATPMVAQHIATACTA